jgi:hypothetical protein
MTTATCIALAEQSSLMDMDQDKSFPVNRGSILATDGIRSAATYRGRTIQTDASPDKLNESLFWLWSFLMRPYPDCWNSECYIVYMGMLFKTPTCWNWSRMAFVLRSNER